MYGFVTFQFIGRSIMSGSSTIRLLSAFTSIFLVVSLESSFTNFLLVYRSTPLDIPLSLEFNLINEKFVRMLEVTVIGFLFARR